MEKFGAVIESKIKEIHSLLGISDEVIHKIDRLYEGGLLGKTVDTDVSFDIHQGRGSGKYDKTTCWVTLDGYFTITSPNEGTWHFVVKDGNTVIIDANNVHKGNPIHFRYKTGGKIHLQLDAWWSEAKDTKLIAHIHATY